MKALIVDDEKHVREGLILLAKWEKYGIDTILEAVDGAEAMKLITEHEPEIIFTDMHMPRCDGIELIKWLHAENIHAKTIVVSGYDDFMYLKNAIKYGTCDYLLKPIHQRDLDDTLGRAVEKWQEQHAGRLAKLANDQAVWDHLLSGSLKKPQLPDRVIEEIKQSFRTNVSHEQYTIALQPITMAVHKAFQGDKEQAFSTLLPIINKVLARSKKGVAFRNRYKEEEIAVLLWEDIDYSVVVGDILALLKKEIGLHLTLITGRPSRQINEAYASARSASDNHNLFLEERAEGDGLLCTADTESKQTAANVFDYAEELKWAVQSGSREQLDDVLEQIFTAIQQCRQFTREQLNQWENEFDILKGHWFKEYGIDAYRPLSKGDDYWGGNGRFSFTRFKAEKRKQFHELLEIIGEVEYKKEKNSVRKIEEYLRLNYQKDISLSEIADRFYLSREYISRKFKQQFHETMTDYVTKIRIDKAKELLANPYLKVYEIANAVGYQNDKYFIKVFKKIEGRTPSEYRASLLDKGEKN
ncbi:two-component system, response regulator YesN [Evansella caseinilytica]|uniref:Two-component system, response regulator YesN n=1 Tax=Evansella caseinilytica TaxID=1503961 RepID=A0A1H3HBI5_9BACI|nr:response regulator [Evansella caseinilytica]SDY12720.1 two-component system, response regulator YesN [Evansella caseinilytica]